LKNPTIADVCFTFVTRWGSEEEARNFINMYSASVRKRYKQASAGDKTGEWTTEEGRVTIQPYGNLVVVNESFDPALSARLTGAALSLDLPDGTSTATAKAVGR